MIGQSQVASTPHSRARDAARDEEARRRPLAAQVAGTVATPLGFRDAAGPWWRPGAFELTHAKWSLEVWLPLALSRSRWAANGDAANATLVPHASRPVRI